MEKRQSVFRWYLAFSTLDRMIFIEINGLGPSQSIFLRLFAGGQDGTPEDDIPYWMAMAGDGSVICVGQTYGSWDGDANGDSDFAAFRLDGNGEEIWRYQVGFSPKRELADCAYKCSCSPRISNH